MSGDFIDSNVLLYLFSNEEAKFEIARNLVDTALREGDTSISFQVIQEVVNVLTRRASPPPTPEDVRRHLRDVLLPLWRVSPTSELYERALDLHWRYQYSFYDSLIVAAALEDGCNRLLSEDLQDGQRIEGLTIVNPFTTR